MFKNILLRELFLVRLRGRIMVEEKIKIILDTDNGDDIDDLFTVYIMLNSNKFDVVGIICSYLNTPLRVKQIKHVLKLKGREDIPVFAGCGSPIKGLHDRPCNTIYWQYSDVLNNYKCDEKYDGKAAVDFLISSAKKYQGELHIVEVAPETTLAKAIKKDKAAFKKSKIFIMGGAFLNEQSEWNIECDVEAARIVLESGLDVSYCGLDVTRATIMTDQAFDNFTRLKGDNYLNYLIEATRLWHERANRNPTLHDPLTLLSTIEDVVSFKSDYMKLVEHPEKPRTSFVSSDGSGEGYHLVKYAYSIDVQKTNNLIFGLLGVKDKVLS